MTKQQAINNLQTEIKRLEQKVRDGQYYARYFGAAERGRLRTVVTHEIQAGLPTNRETLTGRIVAIDDDCNHDMVVVGLLEAPTSVPQLYGLDDFVDTHREVQGGHYASALRELARRIERHLFGAVATECPRCGDAGCECRSDLVG